MMAIPVEYDGDRLVTRLPEPLFEDRFMHSHSVTNGIISYTLHPDGRFLMIEPMAETEVRLIFVENWRAKVQEMFSDEGP